MFSTLTFILNAFNTDVFFALQFCAMMFLAVLVCWTRSTFMSLMYSVLLFINATLVMFMLGFEFLAVVNIYVYVGALAVLFLFVIMLLDMPATSLRAYRRGWSVAGLSLALAILAGSTNLPVVSLVPCTESLSSVAQALYVRYADLLLLNSFILTVALFGALVLAQSFKTY